MFVRLKASLLENRQRIERDLAIRSDRWLFSPVMYSHVDTTIPMLDQLRPGQSLLDVGCGHMPLREDIEQRGVEYRGLDVRDIPGLDFQVDAGQMIGIRDSSYDAVLCMEVLEHVLQPARVLSEIHRVLRPGGLLVLTVPHLSRIHDAPQDYWRFTRYSIVSLLEECGFAVRGLHARGGLVSFIGHQISTILLSLVWGSTVLRTVAWHLNALLITRLSHSIDSRIGFSGALFPVGYSVAAVSVGVHSGEHSDG